MNKGSSVSSDSESAVKDVNAEGLFTFYLNIKRSKQILFVVFKFDFSLPKKMSSSIS